MTASATMMAVLSGQLELETLKRVISKLATPSGDVLLDQEEALLP